jgi:SAM-dependent methyltransferase
METILEKHKRIWQEKKILRIIYSEWYSRIISDLKETESKTVELGAGSGNFKEFKPNVVSADIDPHEWLDMVFDAHRMPFSNKTLGNIVMIDVLHHLSNPVKFLLEAGRVLEKGGKLIMLEPYPSPFSLQVYKRFHPEPFIMDADYFNKADIEPKDPWDSNQAIPYLIFFKDYEKFLHLFQHQFRVIKRQKLSFMLYPASGGFENKSLIPDLIIPIFQGIEWLLKPLRNLLAFRCYLVLEKV